MKPHFIEKPRCRCTRRAILMSEAAAALGLLCVALVLVAEISAWSFAERGRSAARQQALEEAANALEVARARPWVDLTPEWGTAQRLSEASGRLPEGKLVLRVEAEPNRPRTKRVTAVVSWKRGAREEQVELVTLLSARSADMGGMP